MPGGTRVHEGRTYAVTGAASGIGAATAAWLRACGGRVIACDLTASDKMGVDVAADLATAAGRAALVEGVTRLSGGRLDGVVANAGGGPAATMIALNFFGAVMTLEGLRPLLAKSDAPRGLAISSVSSLRPADATVVEACLGLDEPAAAAAARALEGAESGLALYGSAKQALNRWARRTAIAPAWAEAGIPLNVIAPGVVDTPAADWILSTAEGRAEMTRLTPLPAGRPAHADQLAALAAWCVGPDNALMTGQVLYADGGLECRARGDVMW
jgi:NAD(P)-dependent dehydrogenase (short-subunit alcohol dehydrogenase family)